jgi:hypothetical protein
MVDSHLNRDAFAAKKEVDVSHMDNVTGPLSRRVTHEDGQGIETLFKAAADAWRKEDVQALMTLYDLPIYAGTDNAAGAYQAALCDDEQLRAILTALMRGERKDVSRAERRTPHFLSDSMAMVLVETSVTRNGDALGSYTSAILVIKKGGVWRFKSGVAAGHGK